MVNNLQWLCGWKHLNDNKTIGTVDYKKYVVDWILEFSYLVACPPGWLSRVQLEYGRCPRLPFGQKLPVGDTAGGALPHLSASRLQWSASPHCRSCSCNYGNPENTVWIQLICRCDIFYCIPLNVPLFSKNWMHTASEHNGRVIKEALQCHKQVWRTASHLCKHHFQKAKIKNGQLHNYYASSWVGEKKEKRWLIRAPHGIN